MALASGFPGDSKVELTVEDQMDKNGLSSFLMGLGVGVAIGMLFAPKAGSETRDFIKNKAGEGTDYLKQQGTQFRQNASDWVDKGKEAIRSQRENFSDAVEAGKQAYRDAVGSTPAQQPTGAPTQS